MLTVATVVTVGAAGYNAYNSNKQAKGVRNAYGKAMDYAKQNPGLFGEKIDFEPVEYNPLYKSDPGYGKIAGDTIAGNQRNLPANLNLMRDTNKGITEDALTRLNTLYPQFQGQFNQQSRNTANLLAGNIPQEDRNAITAKRTEAQSLGGGGANQQQVAADLGLSRMQAMESGAANLTNNINLWNAIDPVSRRVTPQSMFVDPAQAISSSIQENQFGATFGAAERDAEINYNMLPDPQKAGWLNMLSGQAGVQAATPMQSVGGAMASAAGSSLMGMYGGGGWGATGSPGGAPAGGGGAGASYTPTYATAADQKAGYPALSGAGPIVGQTYYPGSPLTQQGSLSTSFYSKPKQNPASWGLYY